MCVKGLCCLVKTMTILISLFLLGSVFSECTQNSDCGGLRGSCDVTIAGKRYCSKCGGKDAQVPIDGQCRLLNMSQNICVTSTNSEVSGSSCSSCMRGFLLYRGGCYRKSSLVTSICSRRHIVGDGMYCGECVIEGDIPIDGICVTANPNAMGNICSNGVCLNCTTGYFFHYGSCYKLGQSPGVNICGDTDTNKNSICSSCNSGFTKNPKASNSNTSCFDCNGSDGTLFCEECRITIIDTQDAAGQGMKSTLCTKCKSGYVPVEGYCLSIHSASAALAGCSTYNGNKNTMGLCENCLSGYMFFYGSCYSVNSPIAQAICSIENQIYLGGRVFCKKCAQLDHYPINGLCTVSKGLHTCSDGICTKCDTSTDSTDNSKVFLFYNGCYDANSLVGKLICSEASDGVCTSCASTDISNVVPLTSTDGKITCLACWDKEVTGVDNCGGCTANTNASPAFICTKCTDSTKPENNVCHQALPPVSPKGCAVQGCQTCSVDSSTSCTVCFPPLVMSYNKTNCVGDCLALGKNFYNDAGICKPCTTYCLRCNDAFTCLECGKGYYLYTLPINFQIRELCLPCATGCLTCTASGEGKCSSCAIGYYATFNKDNNEIGKCVPCDSSESGYNGIKNCIVCRTVDQSSGTNNVVCDKCENGYTKNQDGSFCEPSAQKCHVKMCAICDPNDPYICKYCKSDTYLCPRTRECITDCSTCNRLMYPDKLFGECRMCDIANCQACATETKCDVCATDTVPVSSDIYHTSCMWCDDTKGINGWVGLAGCKKCELTDKGSGAVNCLDPDYYRKVINGGSIAGIVFAIVLLLAIVGFLVCWFIRKKSKRAPGYIEDEHSSLLRGEPYDHHQALI